jgi:hypothetical protein
VSSAVDNLATLNDKDHIGLLHSVKSVSNGQDSRASRRPLKTLLQSSLAGSIKGACALIKEKQTRTTDEGTSDGETLSLTTRQSRRRWTTLGIITVRKSSDNIVDVGQATGLFDLGISSLVSWRSTQAHVEPHAAVEQGWILRYKGNSVAE